MLEPYNHKIESKRSKMKEYKIVYLLKNGEVGYVYVSRRAKAVMEEIKELRKNGKNPVVAIGYTRLR